MLKWNGPAVIAEVLKATKVGIDKTMADASIHAKQNHPGWKNVTSTAEGSVRPVQFAIQKGASIVGVWGSVDVNYVIWLELKHGSFLRNAADVVYPQLKQNIKDAYGK